jgi:hypothetical protein
MSDYEGYDAEPYDRGRPPAAPADGPPAAEAPGYGYPPSGPPQDYGPGYGPDAQGVPQSHPQGQGYEPGYAQGPLPSAPVNGFPQPPAAPPAGGPPGYGYGYPPAGPGEGYGAAAAGGQGQGYPQAAGQGYPPGFPAEGRSPGYGYPQDGYPQDGGRAYAADGPAGGGHSAHGYAHGYGYEPYAEGAAYVPEPLGGQMPSEVEPGAGYGMPAAGDAWGGHAPAPDAYGAPATADGWGAAPAAAHPWGASAAPGYVESEAESVLERTAAMPVVEMETGSEPAPGPQAPPRRTGSPIIAPGIQPAALTAVLGLLMAGGAAVGKPGLAVLLVVLEAVTAAGWFRLNGMWPARQGIALAFLAGVTADIAVLAVNGGHGPVALLGTLGVWLLLVLVLQLRHHGSADERLSSLTATSASALLTVVAAGYLATATSHAGTDPVVVGTVAVAAATLVRAVRLPGGEPVSVAVSLVVAAVTGLLTGSATGFGTGHGLLLAAAAGVCALVGLRVASYDWPSRFVHFTAGVALPLTAAAPVVYALGVALT